MATKIQPAINPISVSFFHYLVGKLINYPPLNKALLFRINATILLLLLLGDCFFYYSYFNISFMASKIAAIINVSSLKENDLAQTSLLKIAVSSLDKDQDDEVWYHGALYDVVKRETNGNTNYVYLLADDVEEDLIVQNFNYFQTDTAPFSKRDFVQSKNNKTNRYTTDHQYLQSKKKQSSFFIIFIFIADTEHKKKSESVYKKNPSPPPKIPRFI